MRRISAQRPGGPPEPLRAEPVDHPAAPGQRQEAERHRHALDGARPERGENHAERLDQRVGGGGDRHPVGGRLPARELPAPGERVERVVVGEADAADHAQQHGPGDDRRQGS